MKNHKGIPRFYWSSHQEPSRPGKTLPSRIGSWATSHRALFRWRWLALLVAATTLTVAALPGPRPAATPVSGQTAEQAAAMNGFQPETRLLLPDGGGSTALVLLDSRNGSVSGAIASTENATSSRWTSTDVRRGDSLASLLKRAGASAGDIEAVSAARPKMARRLLPGRELRLRWSDDATGSTLMELRYPESLTRAEALLRENQQFVSKALDLPLQRRPRYISGEIRQSLFLDGQDAGLSDALIMQLVEIFGWDIDFALDLREGDRFSVIHEELYREGRKLGNGLILAAEFVNQGKTFRAIAHREGETDNRHVNYYTPDGHSLKRAFLKTPVKFSRISSGFTLRRYHPLLKRWRAHKGVDYAASRGTPVRATASGTVDFIGRKGGYGNTVILRHGGAMSTLYAHLNSFKRTLRRGHRVQQGDIIAFVGSTGQSTGPHLHYEFRINGVHRNPLTYPFPKAQRIAGTEQSRFLATAQQYTAQLDVIGGRVRLANR